MSEFEGQIGRVEASSNHRILVVVTMPKEAFLQLGLPSYESWFAQAMGLPDNRVNVVSAIDEPLPTTIPESGIVIGGSSHSVYEDIPWIRDLEEFIRSADRQKKPLLGVCFGHQAIAQALGGRVEKGEMGREFGTAEMKLTPEGRRDKLFDGMPESFTLATSHSDVVTQAPEGADTRTLANGTLYPNQSFAVGDHIRTIQPHPEITCDVLSALARSRKDIFTNEGFVQGDKGFEELMDAIKKSDYVNPGRQILQNFDRYFAGPYAQGTL